MKINIIGDGSFGGFLKRELPNYGFELSEDAKVVIFAVPISAYNECGAKFKDKHLINVCSVQKPSTDILLKHTDTVTSIHPLFGARTPADKRFSILARRAVTQDDTWFQSSLENEFLEAFGKFSVIHTEMNGVKFTPENHDLLMAKTHFAALNAAKQMEIYTDRMKDIPDEFLPNSCRKLLDFVNTLKDMPAGTIESIRANPFT